MARQAQPAAPVAGPPHARIEVVVADSAKRPTAEPEVRSPSLRNELTLANRTVRISDLVEPGLPLIRGRTFHNIHFVGPAVVAMQGGEWLNTIIEKHPDAAPEDVFYERRENQWVQGVYVFQECRLQGCRFGNVSFIGTRDQINIFLRFLVEDRDDKS